MNFKIVQMTGNHSVNQFVIQCFFFLFIFFEMPYQQCLNYFERPVDDIVGLATIANIFVLFFAFHSNLKLYYMVVKRYTAKKKKTNDKKDKKKRERQRVRLSQFKFYNVKWLIRWISFAKLMRINNQLTHMSDRSA